MQPWPFAHAPVQQAHVRQAMSGCCMTIAAFICALWCISMQSTGQLNAWQVGACGQHEHEPLRCSADLSQQLNPAHSLQVISTARTCNVILIVLDCLKPISHKRLIEHELEGFGIRLNKKPPQITFRKKDKGGISLTTTVSNPKLDVDGQSGTA